MNALQYTTPLGRFSRLMLLNVALKIRLVATVDALSEPPRYAQRGYRGGAEGLFPSVPGTS